MIAYLTALRNFDLFVTVFIPGALVIGVLLVTGLRSMKNIEK